MGGSYSIALRERAIKFVETENGSPKEACSVLGIHSSTLTKWLRRHRDTGEISPSFRINYRKRKVDINILKQNLNNNPDATLEELAKPFSVYPSTIFYHLKKLGITRKKTTLYAERNEERRRQFLSEIDRINPGDLVFLDESGIDEYLQRDYARAERGKQVISGIYGKKFGRISVIAAWLPQAKEMIAPYVFEGYTDSKRFNGWLEKCLLPCLKEGQVVIMDNAAFHKNKRTKELIESVGCRLLYHPPYSPDLNPIEQQWAILKRKFRKHKHEFKTFNEAEAVDYAFVA